MLRYAISAGTLCPEAAPQGPSESLPRPPSASGTARTDASASSARLAETSTLMDVAHPSSAAHRAALRAALLNQILHLATQGVEFLQLREKCLSARELARLAHDALAILRDARAPTRLLLHHRLDVAVATRSHGIHLPSTPGSLTPTDVRRLYRSIGLPAPTVSLSCHTLADIRRARSDSPDLLLFSPVFGKTIVTETLSPNFGEGTPAGRRRETLVSAPIGLEALHEACSLAHPLPVLALGGVTQQNTPACLQAGASGVAGIRLFQQTISPPPHPVVEATDDPSEA